MRKSQVLSLMHIRKFTAKVKVKFNEGVESAIEGEELKFRHHPGTIRPKSIILPKWIPSSIKRVLEGKNLVQISEDAKLLEQYLHSRHPPPEHKDVAGKIDKVLNKLYPDRDPMTSNENDLDMRSKKIANKLLKQNVYHWQPIDYTTHRGLCYLFRRSIPEYTVLSRIFNELKSRDEDFQPKQLFDFGSGVGTVSWAASQLWSQSLKEYYCLDPSVEMNDLSQELLKLASPAVKTVFYRQFMPVTPIPHDLVVSAYSLFELPSLKSRLETILSLWKKTEHYLVIVEQGTNAGFKLVNEARDFILHYVNTKRANQSRKAHIVAPCPHDFSCPRYQENKIPCNFQINYYTLGLKTVSELHRERFSYVIIKKGERSGDDEQWPRIVQPILNRSKHSICRMCTASGELKEVIFTASKHGTNLYRCARSSIWGDRLPIKIENATIDAKDDGTKVEEEEHVAATKDVEEENKN